jgi:hypothetical protein
MYPSPSPTATTPGNDTSTTSSLGTPIQSAGVQSNVSSTIAYHLVSRRDCPREDISSLILHPLLPPSNMDNVVVFSSNDNQCSLCRAVPVIELGVGHSNDSSSISSLELEPWSKPTNFMGQQEQWLPCLRPLPSRENSAFQHVPLVEWYSLERTTRIPPFLTQMSRFFLSVLIGRGRGGHQHDHDVGSLLLFLGTSQHGRRFYEKSSRQNHTILLSSRPLSIWYHDITDECFQSHCCVCR